MSRQICGYVTSHGRTRHNKRTFGFGVLNKDIVMKTLNEVRNIPFSDEDSSFNVGDYGACEGRGSMSFIKELILLIRELHGAQTEVKVVYEDLPTNNFNSLISNISGTVSDVSSYLEELAGVYPFASGMEFRKQVVPSDSMHFIFSVNCIHWLTKCPFKFENSVSASEGLSLSVLAKMIIQSQSDWGVFLQMRSKELKKGGVLMVVCPGLSETEFEGKSYVQLLDDLWKSYRDEGTITEQEFLDTNITAVPMSPDTLRQPFDEKESQAYKSGLRLVSAELIIKDPTSYTIWKAKLDNEGVDDRAEFVRDYLAANWYWSNGNFFEGLSGERSESEKHGILDKLYRDVEREMMGISPEEFKGDLVHSFLLIRKE